MIHYSLFWLVFVTDTKHCNFQRLMLLRETVAVYCENRTEHIHTVRVQNGKFLNVKVSGTYSNHVAPTVAKKHGEKYETKFMLLSSVTLLRVVW
jgi:hypothetical protein